MLCLFSFLCLLDDSQPLITQQLVDSINSNPNSPFKAQLHPQFAHLTIGDAKKFLSPVRKAPISGHGSPRPIGANESLFQAVDRRAFTGYPVDSSIWNSNNKYRYTVYNSSQFCSSWAPAVTSAMSLALSIHHRRFINLSIQFILDCDILGDSCIERPPLNAYEQFWKRYIPQVGRWDNPVNVLRPPHYTLSQATCNSKAGCYPGWVHCPRNLVMTGSCLPEEQDTNCPIYHLYNWKWIKSHLWEVGPVTSSVLVRQSFFTYKSGVYSGVYETTAEGIFPDEEYEKEPSGAMTDVLGMIDVTIIGWGQVMNNLNEDWLKNRAMYNRWWYVIPHLGREFGEKCEEVFDGILENVECPVGEASGIMRFNRRFDDSGIESRAVGAVPFNFHPVERTIQ
jgi:hypothetical protein